MVSRSSEAHVELGYEMNVVGFGWTNAAFLEMLHGLPKEDGEIGWAAEQESLPLPPAPRVYHVRLPDLFRYGSCLVCNCSAKFSSFSASSFFPISR